jgi:thiamine-monophosphate kinase
VSSPTDPSQRAAQESQREDDVLERIASILARDHIRGGEVHIGDDAAVLLPTVGETLISTDVCVAGVHLDTTLFPIEDLGYKAVVTAFSDIAAMGGRALACVVGVIAPSGGDLDALHHGMAEASQFVNAPIVGGDVTRGRDFAVAVTVLGECAGRGAVLRSGARPGDTLMVTGPLGRAAAGLRRRREGTPLNDELVTAHRRPWPCLAEGVAARDAGAHAMMDLSDGLGIDVHRMADASGVGFALTDIPVAHGATWDEAVSGGEDYELLIATDQPDRLRMIYQDRGLDPLFEIGRVVAQPSLRTLSGSPFVRRGFEHRF